MERKKDLPKKSQEISESLRSRIYEMTGGYHNRQHVESVIFATEVLATQYNLSYKDKELLKIAALYHDIEQPNGSAGHEERGAKIAEKELRDFGFSEEDISTVVDLIKVTKGGKEGEKLFVTHPKNLMEEIMCDADFCAFGSYEFMKINKGLQKEVGVEDVRTWLQNQIDFILSHEFHTSAANEIWGEMKDKNIGLLKAKLYGLLKQ